jgi:hypothetical protein
MMEALPVLLNGLTGPKVGSDLMLTLQAIPHNPAGFGGNARAEDGGIVEGRSDRTACWTGLVWSGTLLWPCGPREYLTFQSQCPEDKCPPSVYLSFYSIYYLLYFTALSLHYTTLPSPHCY